MSRGWHARTRLPGFHRRDLPDRVGLPVRDGRAGPAHRRPLWPRYRQGGARHRSAPENLLRYAARDPRHVHRARRHRPGPVPSLRQRIAADRTLSRLPGDPVGAARAGVRAAAPRGGGAGRYGPGAGRLSRLSHPSGDHRRRTLSGRLHGADARQRERVRPGPGRAAGAPARAGTGARHGRRGGDRADHAGAGRQRPARLHRPAAGIPRRRAAGDGGAAPCRAGRLRGDRVPRDGPDARGDRPAVAGRAARDDPRHRLHA